MFTYLSKLNVEIYVDVVYNKYILIFVAYVDHVTATAIDYNYF